MGAHQLVSLLNLIFAGVLEAGHALLEGLLLHLVGLASHGGLIKGKLRSLEENAVDGDGHAVLDIDDITNVEVVVVEDFLLAVTEHAADVLLIGFFAR